MCDIHFNQSMNELALAKQGKCVYRCIEAVEKKKGR